jgi:hypothetical protein
MIYKYNKLIPPHEANFTGVYPGFSGVAVEKHIQNEGKLLNHLWN